MKYFIKGIKKKKILTVLALVLIIGISIPFTLSFLIDKTPAVENTFTAGEVNTVIKEDFEKNNSEIKENVNFTNEGDTPVYVRAAVVVNWKDEKDNYSPAIDGDYSVRFSENNNWEKHTDGYYYYTKPVSVDGTTSNLIDTAEPLISKDGYRLSIEILSSAIQSEPNQAVIDAWGQEVFDLLRGGEQ